MTRNQWKPIRTAPRHGEPFLAWEPSDLPEALAAADDDCRMAVCYFSVDGNLCTVIGGEIMDSFEPTHWMPLPSAP